MKLLTSLAPRTDGTVIATGVSGARYVFAANEAGDLVADVTDERDVAQLLALGDRFEPADEADYAAAETLLLQGEGGDDEDDDEPPQDFDDLDTPAPAPVEEPLAAAPVEESRAPAAPATGGKKKRAG